MWTISLDDTKVLSNKKFPKRAIGINFESEELRIGHASHFD